MSTAPIAYLACITASSTSFGSVRKAMWQAVRFRRSPAMGVDRIVTVSGDTQLDLEVVRR